MFLLRRVGALAIVAAIVATSPVAASAQCTMNESFDGGFDNAWTRTDDFKVLTPGTSLVVHFESWNTEEFHGAVPDACVYSDFRAGVRMRDLADTRGKALSFRNNNHFYGYNINLRSSPFNDAVLSKGTFAPNSSILTIAPYVHATDEWVDVEVEMIGGHIKVWLNGLPAIDYVDPNPIPSGWMFLGINAGGTQSAYAEFDDFWVLDVMDAVPGDTTSWGALKTRF